MINLSVSEWCFLKEADDADTYYRNLKDLGFEAVELVRPELRKVAKACGLSVLTTAASGLPGALNRKEDHETLIPALELAIRDAEKDQIPFLIVFSGNRYGASDEEGIDNCAAGLGRVSKLAEQSNVTLILEVFNQYDHANYQADNSEFGFAVSRKVGSTHVKVLFDIYHMHRMGENLDIQILNNLPYIGHFHIAGSPKRDFPGSSQGIDYAGLVPKVLRAGYTGWWGFEFLPQRPAIEELKEARDHFIKLSGNQTTLNHP